MKIIPIALLAAITAGQEALVAEEVAVIEAALRQNSQRPSAADRKRRAMMRETNQELNNEFQAAESNLDKMQAKLENVGRRRPRRPAQAAMSQFRDNPIAEMFGEAENKLDTYEKQLDKYCEGDKCYHADKIYKLGPIDDLWKIFDVTGNNRVTVDEMKGVFAQIASKDKKVITPVRMFASTSQIYQKLCNMPEFKAYYATHLEDPDYYHYGSGKLFARLQAKYDQVIRTEDLAADEVREKTANEAVAAEQQFAQDVVSGVDWAQEGANMRQDEVERRAKQRGNGRDWRRKNKGKGRGRGGWRGGRQHSEKLKAQRDQRKAEMAQMREMPVYKYMKRWQMAKTEAEKKAVRDEATASFNKDVQSKARAKQQVEHMARVVRKYMKRNNLKQHHRMKFLSGMHKGYPFFAMFDKNKDKVISEQEFLHPDLIDQAVGYTTYNQFSAFFRKNAAAICHDPRPQPYGSSSDSDSDESDYDAFFGPLSKLWFTFDVNKNGHISSSDMATAFDAWDLDSKGGISREEFQKVTDPTFLELCYEAAIMSDSDEDCLLPGEAPPKVRTTDSDAEDTAKVIRRRRRCHHEKQKREVRKWRRNQAKRRGIQRNWNRDVWRGKGRGLQVDSFDDFGDMESIYESMHHSQKRMSRQMDRQARKDEERKAATKKRWETIPEKQRKNFMNKVRRAVKKFSSKPKYQAMKKQWAEDRAKKLAEGPVTGAKFSTGDEWKTLIKQKPMNAWQLFSHSMGKNAVITTSQFSKVLLEADFDMNKSLDPSELLWWLRQHEDVICRPFEKKVGELIKSNEIRRFKNNLKGTKTAQNDDSDDKLDFTASEEECQDWKKENKKNSAQITRYPKSRFEGMVEECKPSYQAIMKSVMKAKSAYRHAQRKLTQQATQIRKLMKSEKSKGYFSVFREGGSKKYLDFVDSQDQQVKVSDQIREMFEETCEKKVNRAEIKAKLRTIYLHRQKYGLEAQAPATGIEQHTVSKECPTKFSVPMYKNKSEVILMQKATNEITQMLPFFRETYAWMQVNIEN